MMDCRLVLVHQESISPASLPLPLGRRPSVACQWPRRATIRATDSRVRPTVSGERKPEAEAFAGPTCLLWLRQALMEAKYGKSPARGSSKIPAQSGVWATTAHMAVQNEFFLETACLMSPRHPNEMACFRRRSSRIAALTGGSPTHGGDTPGGGGVGGGGAGNSHHYCQNQPDPDHPPQPPGGHQQTHVDAKLRPAKESDRMALGGTGGGHMPHDWMLQIRKCGSIAPDMGRFAI